MVEELQSQIATLENDIRQSEEGLAIFQGRGYFFLDPEIKKAAGQHSFYKWMLTASALSALSSIICSNRSTFLSFSCFFFHTFCEYRKKSERVVRKMCELNVDTTALKIQLLRNTKAFAERAVAISQQLLTKRQAGFQVDELESKLSNILGSLTNGGNKASIELLEAEQAFFKSASHRIPILDDLYIGVIQDDHVFYVGDLDG